MKNTIKLLFLTVLSLLNILTSCKIESNDNHNNPINTTNIEDTTSVSPSEPEESLELEEINWGGREFRVLGNLDNSYPQFTNFEIDVEELNGDIINDAVYERNAAINEKYNVDVVALLDTAPMNTIQKYVSAGDIAFETSFIRQHQIPSIASGGYFIDMYDLPYINWEKSWWHEDANNALSIDGRLYFTTSAFNVMDKNRMYLIIFNKDMADEFQLGNMYELVNNGIFTIDKVTEMTKAVSEDLDGDGVMTDADRYGWTQDSYNASIAVFQAMDNWVVTKNNNDIPELTINNEKAVISIDKMLALTVNKETSLSCEMFIGKVSYSHWSVSSKIFKDNRSLFTTSFINYPNGIKSFSANCDFSYGILPFPKYNEEQEKYISTPDKADGTLLAVPKTITDKDFVGYMLELLSYTTKETVMPVYYEISAKDKYTYDKESADMLDLIFSSPRYDLGIIFNWGGIGMLPYDLAKAQNNDFSSKYSSLESKALNELQTTIDIFSQLS